MEKIKQAYKIALADLRACYAKQGIYAGVNHFHDYWARDALFAALGSLEARDYGIVKKNLNLFLKFQHKDGQIPMRIGNKFYGFQMIGIKSKYKMSARYTQDKGFNRASDGNSLFIISLYEYIQKTGDYKFFETNFSKINKVMEWNFRMDKDYDLLMEEWIFACWTDSIRKKGKVLFTNVLHCHAIKLFALMCEDNYPETAEKYHVLYEIVKQKINTHFWNGRYYIDWIDRKPHDFFSTDGNVLAILFDIADKKKAESIQACIKKFKINDTPTLTNYPKYPNHLLSLIDALAGVKDYHNGIRWLWLGCLDAVAKQKLGMKKEAKELIEKISKNIIKHKGVNEIFDENGEIHNGWLYKSEQSFAWSAGLFVYAVKKLKYV